MMRLTAFFLLLVSLAFSTTSAHAASMTVVVSKIALLTSSTVSEPSVTIYDPANGVGEAATRTVNLFDSAEASGVPFTIATPPEGTYVSMLMFLEEMMLRNSQGVSKVDLLTSLKQGSIGTESGTGHGVLAYGAVGSGAGSISATFGGTKLASITPMTADSLGNISGVPQFDFYMDPDNVSEDGNGNLTSSALPKPNVVFIEGSDQADVPNVTVGVKVAAFDGHASATGSTFPLMVGLFREATDPKAQIAKEITAVSTTDSTDITEIEFIDIPNGTYIPVAWIDTNADTLWDPGEPTATVGDNVNWFNPQQLPDANNVLFISETASTDISASDPTLAPSYTLNGFVGDANGGSFFLMGPRAITVTIRMEKASDVGAFDTANAEKTDSGLEVSITTDSSFPANTDPASGAVGGAISLSVVTAGFGGLDGMISTTSSFDVKYALGHDDDSDTNLDQDDAAHPTVSNTTAVNSLTNITYSDSVGNGAIVVSNVPLHSVEVVGDDNSTTGTWAMGIQVGIDGGGTRYSSDIQVIGEDDTSIFRESLSSNSIDITVSDGLIVSVTTP